MENSKHLAQRGKDLLALCLANAIEKAMVQIQGPDWFAAFVQEDEQQEPKKQIVKNGQRNIMDLDLQALLKILRYRDSYADRILLFYGFISAEDEFAAQGQMRQLRSLLDRLITDFRNQMEAHTRVADIEKPETERLYGYEEALQDMAKLARIFRVVKDNEGASYYDQIKALQEKPKKKHRLPKLIAAVVVVAAVAAGLWLWRNPPAQEPTAPAAPTEGNVFYNPNNATITPGEFTIRPKHVYFEGDELIAKCFIINGTEKTVVAADLEQIVISNKEGVICAASFGIIEDISIAPNSYLEKTLRFPAEAVLWVDADLSYLHFSNDCRYLS